MDTCFMPTTNQYIKNLLLMERTNHVLTTSNLTAMDFNKVLLQAQDHGAHTEELIAFVAAWKDANDANARLRKLIEDAS